MSCELVGCCASGGESAERVTKVNNLSALECGVIGMSHERAEGCASGGDNAECETKVRTLSALECVGLSRRGGAYTRKEVNDLDVLGRTSIARILMGDRLAERRSKLETCALKVDLCGNRLPEELVCDRTGHPLDNDDVWSNLDGGNRNGMQCSET